MQYLSILPYVKKIWDQNETQAHPQRGSSQCALYAGPEQKSTGGFESDWFISMFVLEKKKKVR